jgi:putative ribosome biogenesis GTPase RsgA
MLTMLLLPLPFASLLLLCCCRFADCMHLAEPGCAVTEAELERHEHYVKFLAEVKVRAEW